MKHELLCITQTGCKGQWQGSCSPRIDVDIHSSWTVWLNFNSIGYLVMVHHDRRNSLVVQLNLAIFKFGSGTPAQVKTVTFILCKRLFLLQWLHKHYYGQTKTVSLVFLVITFWFRNMGPTPHGDVILVPN